MMNSYTATSRRWTGGPGALLAGLLLAIGSHLAMAQEATLGEASEDSNRHSNDGVTVLFDADDVRVCPLEPVPGTRITRGADRGGGMAGDGWDGPGQNAVTIFWHVVNATPDFGAAQRQALIAAMQAWAGVVRITFQELPVPNQNVGVDWSFQTGDHCAAEAAECGDPDCPFDGAGGILAHAGFPPGVNSLCTSPMTETFAGNVHFDEGETWEQDNAGGSGPYSLTLIACHELGHAIGLVHDNSGGGDVMRPTFSSNDGFGGLSADDIANIQSGYASGTGAVITLNDTGVWVNRAFGGVELGTQANPFNTVAEGAGGVPPSSTDIVVHISAGTYPENLTITQNMVLRAEGGVVNIGR